MKKNTGFFKTNEDPEHGWIWNGYPNKKLGGTEVEINDNKYNITPSIRKVLVKNDKDKVVFRDMLQKTNYFNHKPTKGRISGRDRYNKKPS